MATQSDPSAQPPIETLLRHAGLSLQQWREALRQLDEVERPRMQRWWTYYRNPMSPLALSSADLGDAASERPYRQGQEWGLPPRITGYLPGDVSLSAERARGLARKEVVIENDIGWRVDAMVDHLFGRPLTPVSTHPDPDRRAVLNALLPEILEANGGLSFLQQAAVLGMVYGFVDIAVKLDSAGAASLRTELTGDLWTRLTRTPAAEAAASGGQARGTDETAPSANSAEDASTPVDTGPGTPPDGRLLTRLARLIRLEIVHPSHALPLPRSASPATLYVRTWTLPRASPEPLPASRRRWWQRTSATAPEPPRRQYELLTAAHYLIASDTAVLASGGHALGEIPVVHIQNLAMPFDYAGRSDVEPLIPLQDELNSRLSDRAYRITMQSFRMFLGKGVDNFLSMPVGPGRMWATDNQDAEIEEFGGDQRCPSEEAHIADLREAMDKTSSVPPVAAGLIRDRVGQLSSAAALRVTLQSLLAKTERKRATYGRGLSEVCRLALAWLHTAGLLETDPAHRGVSIGWPSPLPENALERLREAEIKARLGVPLEQVRKEIGY